MYDNTCMRPVGNSLKNYETDYLIQDWFDDLQGTKYEYQEPFFGQSTIIFIKQACDALKQDIHVFMMSLEVLEKYLDMKLKRNESLGDEITVTSAIVFLCSKYVGEQIDLKVKHIEAFISKVTNKTYTNCYQDIILLEVDILKALNGKLPLTTKVDDLNTVVEKFIRQTHLRCSIRPLCLEILQLVFINWREIFFDLKMFYYQTNETFRVFKNLICNKLYIPVGIIITTVKITVLRNILDLDDILSQFTSITRIHADHINLLSAKILLLIKTLHLQD